MSSSEEDCLKCIDCDGKEFIKKRRAFLFEILGQKVRRESDAFVCTNCRRPYIPEERLLELRREAFDYLRDQDSAIMLLDRYERINGFLKGLTNEPET